MGRNITSKIKSCKIEGCVKEGHIQNGKEKYIKGYCNSHYLKFRKYGDPLVEKSRRGESRVKNELLNTYSKIKDRCYNEKCMSFKYYGSRGIKMCDRWLGVDGFLNFCNDMGLRTSKKHSIDRIDNNGNYEPNNCRWATNHQQSANTRRNNKVVGVCFSKTRNFWISYLKVNGKSYRRNFILYKDAVNYRKELELKYLKNG